MGSPVYVPLHGPSVRADPRPATSTPPSDVPSVVAWRAVPGATPHRSAPTAGILVVHDAWGLDADIQALADALAAAGYVVLAPDLAAGWLPTDLDAAEALARSIDPADAARVLAAAVDALRADAAVGRQRVGAIGLGMGAPLAAFVATLRADIAAVVLAGPGPDLADDAWSRTEAAFLALPPAEVEAVVLDAQTWADRLRASGLDVLVAPAAVPPIDAPAPTSSHEAVELALPGALGFLARHLG